jgi:phosphoribosylamine--glycine ligase
VQAVAAAMVERRFGAAGDVVVVEECLTGVEVSFFALCDGMHACYLGSAHDHKRVFDDDRGPNTGGMGAFSPSPLIDAAMRERVTRDIVWPVVNAMRQESEAFTGVLFVGLMLTPDGPKVIEFNVRFGDPETQVVLPLIASDLGDLLLRAATGRLADAVIAYAPGVAVAVVLASGGYPAPFARGYEVRGLDVAAAIDGVHVIHAGTTREEHTGAVHTDGGRVLCVVAEASDYAGAIARVYAGVDCVRFQGMHCRRDIGRRVIAT